MAVNPRSARECLLQVLRCIDFGMPIASVSTVSRSEQEKTSRLEYENQRRGHLLMNTLVNQRRVRKTQPTLEDLDLRIAPATISAGANLAAQLKVESRQVGRWEVSLASASPGSREQTFLVRHIARTEGRMAVQEARLARIESAHAMAVADPAPVRPRHPVPPLEPFNYGTVQSSSPSSSGSTATATGSTSTSTTTLPVNVSPSLGVIYAAYEADPSDFPADIPATDGATLVQIQGTSVGISVQDSNPADFNTLVTALQNAGMQITDSSASYGIVEGFLPVAQLPTVAALADAPSVTPLYQPTLR
jgi:hypothetical protein